MAEEMKQVNPIQAEIDSLIAEREQILKEQDILRTRFEQYDMRLCEINGSIQVLVKLFGKKENADGDTESKTDSESSVDEG